MLKDVCFSLELYFFNELNGSTFADVIAAHEKREVYSREPVELRLV